MKIRQNYCKYFALLLCFAVASIASTSIAYTAQWQLEPDVDYFDFTPVNTAQARAHGMWDKPVYNNAHQTIDEPGEQKSFFVDGTPVAATLAGSGEHISVFVKNGPQTVVSVADEIIQEFDNKIFEKVNTLYGGNAWNIGPVTVLLRTEGNHHLGGFITPFDGFPVSEYRYSNEEAIVIVDLPESYSPKSLYHLLSVQFAYLINLTRDPDESVWLQTALAHYAGFYAGYGHDSSLSAFMYKPCGVSLTNWPAKPSAEHVGAATLFAHYLADIVAKGSPEKLFERLSTDTRTGVSAVESVTNEPFAKTFSKWTATNAVNSSNGHNGQFGYLHIQKTVTLEKGGSLLSLNQNIDGNLPQWSAAYLGFEQTGNWSPDFPTIHDEITFAFDEPGSIIWGINGWKTAPEEYRPENSVEISFNGKRAVESPLVESESVEGLYRVVIPPLKHVTSVDRVDFVFRAASGKDSEMQSLPVSHDQNMSLPAVEVHFKGESGWFSSSKKFALALALKGDEDDCLVKELPLSSKNTYKDVINEFGIYYTRMVMIPSNVSTKSEAGETLSYSFNTNLAQAKRDFERSLHLQIKLYEGASKLYNTIIGGEQSPEVKRRYLVMTRQYAALTDEIIRILAEDMENRTYKDFDILQHFVYSLPKAKVVALRSLLDKVIPALREAILKQNTSGVTPDPELDLLLFKMSNLRAYIYEAGDSTAGGEWDDGDDDATVTDDDIVAPITNEDYLAAVKECNKYLSDLPIDMILARDVLEKILGAFIITTNDEIVELLNSFGLNINIDFTSLPFDYILKLIKLNSYNVDTQKSLVKQWAAGMTPEESESLRRLYLAQQSIQTGFKSSLVMAEDASEGFYDVVDLALGAVKTADKVMSSLEHVPIVGKLAKKLKVKIIQRIMYALNNAVQFITQNLQEPWRSRIAAVCNAITTVYIKWKDVQLEEGFGGINAKLFAKIGAKVIGKTGLLMTPKIGYVSRTQKLADESANLALNNDYYGTFDEARRAVIDDRNPETENAILERVIRTTARKQKLSLQERKIANIAGSVSQIAQYVNLIDPSGVVRIVAIVAGAFAGGLQLHSIFNSVQYFCKLSSETRRAIMLSFNPNGNPDDLKYSIESVPFSKNKSKSALEKVDYFSKASSNYASSLSNLKNLAKSGDVTGLVSGISEFEDASYGFRKGMKMVSLMDLGPASKSTEGDFVSQALMKENFASADLLSKSLDFGFKPNDRRKQRALIKQIENLEQEVSEAKSAFTYAHAKGTIRSIARLDHMAPAAIQAEDTVQLTVTLLNVGNEPLKDVDCTLNVPSNWQITSQKTVTFPSIEAQSEQEVTFTVKRVKKLTKTHQLFTFTGSSANGGQTYGSVYIAKEKTN